MKNQFRLHEHFSAIIITWCLMINVYSSPSYAAEAIGKVIIAAGNVTAGVDGGELRTLKRRSDVFVGEKIYTDGTSSVQIRFTDGSLIALRENTTFLITDFQYAGNEKEDKVALELLKGGFRTITGSVGKGNKDAYKVETPVASIGIRGTNYELVLESKDSLVSGVWAGGIQVANSEGKMDLGNDADFNFSRTETDQAPVGLLEPPAVLDKPLAAPLAKSSTQKQSDSKGGDSDRQKQGQSQASHDQSQDKKDGAEGGSQDKGDGDKPGDRMANAQENGDGKSGGAAGLGDRGNNSFAMESDKFVADSENMNSMDNDPKMDSPMNFGHAGLEGGIDGLTRGGDSKTVGDAPPLVEDKYPKMGKQLSECINDPESCNKSDLADLIDVEQLVNNVIDKLTFCIENTDACSESDLEALSNFEGFIDSEDLEGGANTEDEFTNCLKNPRECLAQIIDDQNNDDDTTGDDNTPVDDGSGVVDDGSGVVDDGSGVVDDGNTEVIPVKYPTKDDIVVFDDLDRILAIPESSTINTKEFVMVSRLEEVNVIFCDGQQCSYANGTSKCAGDECIAYEQLLCEKVGCTEGVQVCEDGCDDPTPKSGLGGIRGNMLVALRAGSATDPIVVANPAVFPTLVEDAVGEVDVNAIRAGMEILPSQFVASKHPENTETHLSTNIANFEIAWGIWNADRETPVLVRGFQEVRDENGNVIDIAEGIKTVNREVLFATVNETDVSNLVGQFTYMNSGGERLMLASDGINDRSIMSSFEVDFTNKTISQGHMMIGGDEVNPIMFELFYDGTIAGGLAHLHIQQTPNDIINGQSEAGGILGEMYGTFTGTAGEGFLQGFSIRSRDGLTTAAGYTVLTQQPEAQLTTITGGQ